MLFGCKYKALIPKSQALHGQGTVTLSGLHTGPIVPAWAIPTLSVQSIKVAMFFMNRFIILVVFINYSTSDGINQLG